MYRILKIGMDVHSTNYTLMRDGAFDWCRKIGFTQKYSGNCQIIKPSF